MSERKVRVHLATDPGVAWYYRLDRERFEAAGRDFPEAHRRIAPSWSDDDAGFRRGIRDAEIIFGWKFPKERLAERAPALRWIQLMGAGVDHLYPLDWLPPGVGLANASGVHTGKSFEYVLMALVALNDRLPRLIGYQQERRWRKIQSGTLPGRTVLIVGLGAVGSGAARAARVLGMRVLGVRRSGRAHEHVDELFRPDELRLALPRADYVVLATPLTGETTEILGAEEIALLPEGAGVVNLGRGRLIHQPSLEAALHGGKLGGAFLDVATPEPLPPESTLWDAPNLIVTPHVGADDINQYVPLCYRIGLENVQRDLAGQPLRNLIDPALGY